jgi:muramoyltetrapeptide carboxypeptidase
MNLNSIGLNVEIHPSCRGSYKGTSGPPSERAEVLMNAFSDNNVNGIMCFWAGWNCNDLLDYLDWTWIMENPKVFIGYSDTTILNITLYEKAGLVNFQGPAFINFTYEFLMPWEVEVFENVLMKQVPRYEITPSPTYIDDPYFYKHPEIPVQENQNPGWTILNEGTTKGRLIGGHLGTLLTLAGTEYWPNMEGKLLFLEEDEGGNPRQLRRQFRQLDHIGVLDEIKGLLIGRIPEITGTNNDLWIGSLVEDILEGRDYPIVAEMDFGHTNPLATIPIGVNAEISTRKKVLTFLETCIQ